MKFTQEQESISKIADKLKIKLERLEEIISEREDYASEKSESGWSPPPVKPIKKKLNN